MGTACFKDCVGSDVSTHGRRSQRGRRSAAGGASNSAADSNVASRNGTDGNNDAYQRSNVNNHIINGQEDIGNGETMREKLHKNLEAMSVSDIRNQYLIDDQVKQTLRGVNNLHELPNREPPMCMLRLHDVAENENGWLAVLLSLVEAIPLDDPVGSAVIMIIIDDCSLPNKATISRLIKHMNLGSKALSKLNNANGGGKWRNTCTVLGCVADKLAGPNAETILTADVSNFLLSCLEPKVNYETTLHALVAIEKIAKTAKNKKEFDMMDISSHLARLESYYTCEDYMAQQVGFCAQWLLDNIFLKPDRPFTYEVVLQNLENSSQLVDNSSRTAATDSPNDSQLPPPPYGAMLNDSDVSEYLKISPDGLTARCDAYSFESVRSTLHVDSGVWFYEVQVVTPGIMQIGWATKNSRFSNHEGFGVGDDELSCAYDGCRQFVWHNAITTKHRHREWKMGDYIGFLIDIDHKEIIFSLNGDELGPEKSIFNFARCGFYAAASFMSFQQCVFNFGATPFQFPPDTSRRPTAKGLIHACYLFDNNSPHTEMPRCILPRHIKQKRLLEEMSKEDTMISSDNGETVNGIDNNRRRKKAESLCFICCTNINDTIVIPCRHTGLCMTCALQIEYCAVCRTGIESRELLATLGWEDEGLQYNGNSPNTTQQVVGLYLEDVPKLASVEEI